MSHPHLQWVGHLAEVKHLLQRGNCRGLIAKPADGHSDMLVFVLMDQDHHYFVVNDHHWNKGAPRGDSTGIMSVTN